LLGGDFTEGTIKQYFSEDGMLHVPYLTYVKSSNEKRLEESITILRRTTVRASYALVDGLERAINAQDDRLIIKYSTMILDRSGLGLENLEKYFNKEDTRRFKTYDEYVTYCETVGIDPKTGLRSNTYQ